MAALTTDTCENNINVDHGAINVDPGAVSDEADEWLFSSIKEYGDLYMYDFEYPTRAMTWLAEERICVACLQPDGYSEILEIILPERLTAEEGDKALLRERDFRVLSGGFHSRHVYEIQYLANSKNIVTTEKNENTVRIWKLGNEDYDVIEKQIDIEGAVKNKTTAQLAVNISGTRLAFGTSVSDLTEVDVTQPSKAHTLLGTKEEHALSGLEYISAHVICMCCKASGNLCCVDSRDPSLACLSFSAPDCLRMPCVFATCAKEESEGDINMKAAVMDSQGHVAVWDIRNTKHSLHTVATNKPNNRGDFLKIQISNKNNNMLSLSGVDGNIYVYDTQAWNEDNTNLKPVEPQFVHTGHETCQDDENYVDVTVLGHMWHCSKSQYMLSSASDGSLHAWNYLRQGSVQTTVTDTDSSKD